MVPVKEGTQKESFLGHSLSLGSGTLQLKSVIGRIPLRCVLHGPSMLGDSGQCLGGTGNKIWKREMSERRGTRSKDVEDAEQNVMSPGCQGESRGQCVLGS